MISETLMQKLNVQGLCDDSRRVKAKDLFFSMPGEKSDEFARTAVASGAVAVVSENVAPEGLTSKWIQVADVKAARLEAAKIFYKDPFAKLNAHAVTGTNGKTTSAFLMAIRSFFLRTSLVRKPWAALASMTPFSIRARSTFLPRLS